MFTVSLDSIQCDVMQPFCGIQSSPLINNTYVRDLTTSEGAVIRTRMFVTLLFPSGEPINSET